MFDAKVLNATTQTLMWVVIFFFASAGASAAYLTVSETWPIEIRAEEIAVFFAIGAVFGGLVEVFLGVQAAGTSLEQVTKPLTSVASTATSAEPAAA
jgi:hypothetical protein